MKPLCKEKYLCPLRVNYGVKSKMTDDQILNFLGLGIDVKTLAEDQMYDDRDGNREQRLESRMEMIIDKPDEMMDLVVDDSAVTD